MGDAQIRANYASNFKRILEFTKTQSFKEAVIEEVEVRLNRLETAWKQFDRENEKFLLSLSTVDASRDDLDGKVYEKAEEMYLAAKVQLTKKINQFKPQPGTSSAANTSNNNMQNMNSTTV